MKKITTFLAIVLILTATALPVFASEDKSPNISPKITTTNQKSSTYSLAGLNITVTDTQTLATGISHKWVNHVEYVHFLSSNGISLGYTLGSDFRTFTQNGIDSKAIPVSGDDRSIWYANQFNAYRGLQTTSAQVNAIETKNTDNYAHTLSKLINDYRSGQGIETLSYDNASQTLADTRAREIKSLWGHTRPDGSVVTDNGYAEIITRGASPEKALENFKKSNQHNAIMLSENYTSYAVGSYSLENGYTYWVVLLKW